MYLTPALIALSFALTPVVSTGDQIASASRAAIATPENRALAETLVGVSGERENEAKAVEPLEHMLPGTIAARLSITDPALVAQLGRVVHEALLPVVGKAIDASVDSYAANFSADELRHVIAFLESPVGQAEKTNLPLLKNELAVALRGSAEAEKAADSAAQMFAAASPAKRALVQRILTAQAFEARTRRGYAMLRAMMNSVTAAPGVAASAGAVESAAEAKAADDYVRIVMEIEEGFYVTHYTDAQLADVAAYLESEPGQAVLTRSSKVKRAVGAALAQGLSSAVSSLPDKVCATLTCSPDQRTRLAELTAALAAGASQIPALTDPIS